MKYSLTLAILLTISPRPASGGVGQSWHLRTDDTVLVVTVQNGTPTITEISSPKAASNWLNAPAPEVLPPTVIHEGSSTSTSWQYEGGNFDSDRGQLSLRFTNAAPALELQSIWRARPGRGPVEHWLTITNKSGSVITLGRQDSLALSHLVIPEHRALDAWWIRRGAGNATTEGGTFVQSIGRNSDQTLISNPNDGASPVPWLALQIGTSGGMYLGWEFSGIGRIHFHSLSEKEAGATITGAPELGIEVGNLPDFKTDLPPSGTFWVPPAFVGCYSGDIDDGSYSLHRFILDKLLPKFPAGYSHPTLAYNFYLDGGGAKAEEKDVLRSAELAKTLGFETLVVDAMWFPQSGAWYWDRKRFPHDYRAIEEYLHTHGMKFGLWMAYTQGSDSNDPRALSITQHPDWFISPPKLDTGGTINWDALIDLGYDPARDWAEHATERVVREYKLDYFKTDYTPIVTKCDGTNHRHHYGVDVSYWSTLGYYAVQEALIREFPDLILEGCSGSGHIKDFGDIQRVHMIAMNDTLSSLPNRQGTYDSTFAFPPAALMNYTYENFYDTISDAPEPYLWRSSMMNQWQIDPTNSAAWTEKQRDALERATEIYKSWIRPILQDVEVHHILPRPDGFHWDGMFYWSPSLNRGTVYVFRPDNDQNSMVVPLKGLVPERKYAVRSEDHSMPDGTYSGLDLMKSGLKISLAEKYTSDLIYVEALP